MARGLARPVWCRRAAGRAEASRRDLFDAAGVASWIDYDAPGAASPAPTLQIDGNDGNNDLFRRDAMVAREAGRLVDSAGRRLRW